MADNTNPPAPPTNEKKSAKSLVIGVALLMLLEGAGVFLLAGSVFGPPSEGLAADGIDGADEDAGDAFAEVVVSQCRPTNRRSGKLITFSVRVAILVDQADKEEALKVVEEKQARIDDRVNFVFRSAELAHLNEPGHDTVKRRIKGALDEVFEGRAVVREVLIPELLQSGSGL